MSFRYVSVIGWNPKKIPLGTTTLPENTHEPHMEATTPNPRRVFWRHGFVPIFWPSFFTRRHEGDLRFWDILGRWLYRVELGFFYIFLLPEEVKDWSLSANWPSTLMERIHLEKDNLPRFVLFRLRHTVLLKLAKFKVWRRSKSQRSLRIAHDNSSLSLQPTIPATFLFHGITSVFEGRGAQNWCEIISDIQTYVKIRGSHKTENPFACNHNGKAIVDNFWESFGRFRFCFQWFEGMLAALCGLAPCVRALGTWGWMSVTSGPRWIRVDLIQVGFGTWSSEDGVLHVDPFMTWKQHQTPNWKVSSKFFWYIYNIVRDAIAKHIFLQLRYQIQWMFMDSPIHHFRLPG